MVGIAVVVVVGTLISMSITSQSNEATTFELKKMCVTAIIHSFVGIRDRFVGTGTRDSVR
jgi:hypothetical protein